MSFSTHLERLMRVRKIRTQGELARRAGFDSGYVSQLLTGKIGRPGPQRAQRLANALGVTLAELYADETESLPVKSLIPDEVTESVVRLHQLTKELLMEADRLLHRVVRSEQADVDTEALMTRRRSNERSRKS